MCSVSHHPQQNCTGKGPVLRRRYSAQKLFHYTCGHVTVLLFRPETMQTYPLTWSHSSFFLQLLQRCIQCVRDKIWWSTIHFNSTASDEACLLTVDIYVVCDVHIFEWYIFELRIWNFQQSCSSERLTSAAPCWTDIISPSSPCKL